MENMKRAVEQMKAEKTFSHDARSDVTALSRIRLKNIFLREPVEDIIEISRNTEIAPEVLSTTVNIPLSLIEAVSSLIFGNTGSDKSKDKSEDAKRIEKTNKSNVTNEPSNVSEPTRTLEGVQNVSEPAISAQPAAVR